MSNALVINPPFLEPHRPPIACAIVAELLRLEQMHVEVRDLNIELYHQLGPDKFYDLQVQHTTASDKTTKETLNEFLIAQALQLNLDSFEWIFISCFSFWNLESTQMICHWLRSNTNAQIVVGGPGIEYQDFGSKLYDQGLIDFFIYGEGEHAIPALIKGNVDFPGINGTAPQQIENIETLPLPNYDYFDLSRYDWLLDSPDVFIYGSRGCVRKCTFCDVEHYWPKFRWRSGQSIANEMINNYEKHGIRNYFFADSLVNGNLKEFTHMCEILASYKEDLFSWGSYAIVRPKSAHPASLFDTIKAAGGKFWSLGIETGVDRIRFSMQKKFTNEDIDWHLEQSQRIDLKNNFLCIPTWPDETKEEHLEYLAMFPRWQNYAVDGTIFGIRLSPTLAIMSNTRLEQQNGSLFTMEDFIDPNISQYLKNISWRANDFSHKEKFSRTLALYQSAIQHHWPVTNCVQVLSELKNAVGQLANNQTKIRRVIPINSC